MESQEDIHFEFEAANINDVPRDPALAAIGFTVAALLSMTFWAAILYWLF